MRAKMTRCRALECINCNANENYTHYPCVSKRNHEQQEEVGRQDEEQPPQNGVAAVTLFFLVDISRTVNFIVGVP